VVAYVQFSIADDDVALRTCYPHKAGAVTGDPGSVGPTRHRL